MSLRAPLLFPFLLPLLLTLAACSTTNVPVRYYALATDTPAATTQAAPAVRVAIANVTLPEALDRANLVLRASPTRLEVLDNDRWAEGLRREIPRVLAGQLNLQQRHAELSYYPQAAAEQADYLLDLDVQRFDAERGKRVQIALMWTLRPARGTGPARSGQLQADEVVSADSIDALVEADGRALAQLARDLAPMLTALPTADRR